MAKTMETKNLTPNQSYTLIRVTESNTKKTTSEIVSEGSINWIVDELNNRIYSDVREEHYLVDYPNNKNELYELVKRHYFYSNPDTYYQIKYGGIDCRSIFNQIRIDFIDLKTES